MEAVQIESLPLRPSHTPSCKVRCSNCNLRETCLPVGLTGKELANVDNRLVALQKKVARGEMLFRSGEAVDAVFAVWTGFFKTVITSIQGREQVIGFHMGGELIGLGGIGTGRHEVDAIALEDSQVCVIPCRRVHALFPCSALLPYEMLQHHPL